MRKVDLDSLHDIFAAYPNVIAVWAFGSAKNGELRAGGDIDLGVLFADMPSLHERIALADAIDHRLKSGTIDLSVLNHASAILRFEALSGRKIYSTDVETEAAFQSLAAREYEHAMWMLKRGLKWQQEAQMAQTPL